jgi:hypothetical protein
MTERQITSRLSGLAGKIALQILGLHEQHPASDPAGTHVPQPLYENYMEFSSLVMGTMVWHNSKFRSIIHTNLDTQVRGVWDACVGLSTRGSAVSRPCNAAGKLLPANWLTLLQPSGYRGSVWIAAQL